MRKVQPFLAACLTFSMTLCSTIDSKAAGNDVTLKPTVMCATQYPSMQPVVWVTVQLADALEIAPDGKWDCSRLGSYTVVILSDNKSRAATVRTVSLQGNLKPGERFTKCGLSVSKSKSVVLTLTDTISASDSVKVTLANFPASVAPSGTGKLPTAGGNSSADTSPSNRFSLTAAPQAAPGESLSNGTKRDVGQLAMKFSHPNLFRTAPFDTYLNSNDLFSTDQKDSKSAFALTVGAQRNLIPKWYAPVHVEQNVQGNQTATNLSIVSTLGITTLLPWSGTGNILNTSMLSIPLPPDLTLNNQYTHRVNQLLAPKAKPLSSDDYALAPSFSWSSINLPWVCRLYSTLDRGRNSHTAETPVAPAAAAAQTTVVPSFCAGLAIDLGLYYLPLDYTKRKSQRVEGYGDVSLLLPLAKMRFARNIMPYLVSGDSTKFQIRIKYSDSVTAANNYARSRQWTYGLEAVK